MDQLTRAFRAEGRKLGIIAVDPTSPFTGGAVLTTTDRKEASPGSPKSGADRPVNGEPACGRGWVTLGTAGRLVGHFFIYKGDVSGFVRERA